MLDRRSSKYLLGFAVAAFGFFVAADEGRFRFAIAGVLDAISL
jgi:hypothetical protein